MVSSSLFAAIRGGVHDHTYIRAQPCSAARSFGWQSRKLILKGGFDFSRNLAFPKIIHRTVYKMCHDVITTGTNLYNNGLWMTFNDCPAEGGDILSLVHGIIFLANLIVSEIMVSTRTLHHFHKISFLQQLVSRGNKAPFN